MKKSTISENVLQDKNYVFGLDIGTRNVVGSVGYKTENEDFIVVAQNIKQHETRAMLDGQIHDIGRVARTIGKVKTELENQVGQSLSEVCIAAAGRVLKTVTTHVEYDFSEETIVNGEDIHTLDLLGIEQAQEKLKESNDTKYKFYCVGYSVVRYYLNGEQFINLEGHKANQIGEDVIVTFLPEDVVDGLYSAVGQVGLNVANMTLEPIAAINVAIPENFRMLNIALVDVGAGTSDISITRDGSIIAYGMIPHAGDAVTEAVVQHFLVDFKMAESMKLQSTESDEITYQDIMSIPHTIKSEELWQVAAPVIDIITSEVAEKIKELNGDKSVSACFVVGGGGKIHGFTDKLAEYLDLIPERVALRGEEVLGEVIFEQKDIKKDPLLVTPIGICLNYYEQKNNFIMVKFNGERLKLYDNNRLTIVDAALQAGFPNDQLFPKRGLPINFTVNGSARIARGEAGEAALVTMNDKPANINTPLEPNCEINIVPSTEGEAAVYTISQLDEYSSSSVKFVINGKTVTCPKFFQVNGSLEPADYQIQEGDEIETRNFYTVGQIAEFMDVVIDAEKQILVNNKEADLNTLVYENFTVDWLGDPYKVRGEENSTLGTAHAKAIEEAERAEFERREEEDRIAREEAEARKKAAEEAATAEAAKDVAAELEEGQEEVAAEASAKSETEVQEEAGEESAESATECQEEVAAEESEALEGKEETTAEKTEESEVEGQRETSSEESTESEAEGQEEAEAEKAVESVTEGQLEATPEVNGKTITVMVNNNPVELIGKDTYIFVDIFDRISFDLKAGNGRMIVTKLNGEETPYTAILKQGDEIEIYWKEL